MQPIATHHKYVVEKLLSKAALISDANEAMKFAQAALNAANALCSLREAMKPVEQGRLT